MNLIGWVKESGKIDSAGPGGLLSRQRRRHVPHKNLGSHLAWGFILCPGSSIAAQVYVHMWGELILVSVWAFHSSERITLSSSSTSDLVL